MIPQPSEPPVSEESWKVPEEWDVEGLDFAGHERLSNVQFAPSNEQKHIDVYELDGDVEHADADDSDTSARKRRPSDSERPPPTRTQVIWIYLATLFPNIMMVIFFSAIGVGTQVFSAVAPRIMNFFGNCVAAFAALLLALLYVFDFQALPISLQMTLGLLQFVLLISASVLKGVWYPWAPMMFTLLSTYVILLILRASPCKYVSRKYFYLAIGGAASFTAFVVLVVWVTWIYSGNEWNLDTKYKLVADTKAIYDNVYKKGALVYEVHCKPGVELAQSGHKEGGYTEKEIQTISAKCEVAATVWFLVWIAPFISVIVNFVVAGFCVMIFRLGSARDVSRLQKTLKHFTFLFTAMITGMYASVYASGGLMKLGSAFMAFCAAFAMALIIWLYLEVPSQVLMHIATGSKLTEYLMKAYRSDVGRAMTVMMVNVLIPLFFFLDMGRKKVRRMRAITEDPDPHTEQGQKLFDELKTWNWISILTWLCTLCEVAFVLNIGMKVTYVFFSWLNDTLADVDLGFVIILVYAVGLVMFLLPPVPGSAVYVFAGIVLGRKTQAPDSVGFIPGVAIACVLGLFTKLCACVGQYMIGYTAGKSVKVQQLIGVDKVFTRAIEKILNRRGLAPGKVAILVGGPDWPTSVTCGILKLNIPQMLIGTVPVGIVSVAPQTLMGALLTKETGAESGFWTLVAAFATVLSVVGQVGAMLTATYFTTKLIENEAKELAAPRPEHQAVEDLTKREKAFVDKFKELTNPYDKLKGALPWTWLMVKISVVLHLLAFFAFGFDFVISEPMCFRKFAIINNIGDTFDKGGLNNNVINLVYPLGWLLLAIFFAAVILHYVWAKRLTQYVRGTMGE